jgi:hypothetical protein
MDPAKPQSIKYPLGNLLNHKVKLAHLCFTFCLGILIFSCSKSSMITYPIHLPGHDYSFTVDTNIFKFELDTNKIYIGDPILFSFINNSKKERFDFYLGTKDPNTDWKYTFDFQETWNTLEQQIKLLDTSNIFISKQSIEYWECPGRLVQYSFERWKRIDSQFICLNGLRINIILSADIKADDDNLLLEYNTALLAIKLNDKPFR